MSKNQDKKINIKDYCYVVFLFLITIVLVLILKYFHQSYSKYDLKQPVIRGEIQELHADEFEDYLTEHDDFFLYICNSWNESCRNVEKALPKLLKKRNIKANTIYINSGIGNKDGDDLDTEKKVLELLKRVNYNDSNLDIPLFMIVHNKQLVASVKNDNNRFTIENIDELLDVYEIGV